MPRRTKETNKINMTSKKRRIKPSLIGNRKIRIDSNNRHSSNRDKIRIGSNSRHSSKDNRIRIDSNDRHSRNNKIRIDSNNRHSSNKDRIRIGSNNRHGCNSAPSAAKSSNACGKAPGKTIAPGAGSQTIAHGSNEAVITATEFLTIGIADTSDRSISSVSSDSLLWSITDTHVSNTRVTG